MGTPRDSSFAISSSIIAWDWRSPGSSSFMARSWTAMSYQARITKPPLMVTARIGACGNTKRTPSGGSDNSSTIGTKSFPSAPNPCSQITL